MTNLAILNWPVVVLVIALVAMFVFRTPLSALIQRTKSVGKTGIETYYEAQPAEPRDEKKAIDEFLKTYDNPLISEAEDLIRQDLKQRKIETPPDREKALIRSCASLNIILRFERDAQSIWRSQLGLLRFLNARAGGANIDESVEFYEVGKRLFPKWYVDYPFEKWLVFLQSSNLIERNNSRVAISVEGREFLKYLVASGRPDPYYG